MSSLAWAYTQAMWEEGQGGMGMGLRVVCLAYQRKSSEVEKRYYVFFYQTFSLEWLAVSNFLARKRAGRRRRKYMFPISLLWLSDGEDNRHPPLDPPPYLKLMADSSTL